MCKLMPALHDTPAVDVIGQNYRLNHMSREGCATFHVVYMMYVVIVTYFVRTWIVTIENDFVCLTSDLMTTFNMV